MNFPLDTGPMIAFLDNEPGAEVVEDVLTEPGSSCCAQTFNLVPDADRLSLEAASSQDRCA